MKKNMFRTMAAITAMVFMMGTNAYAIGPGECLDTGPAYTGTTVQATTQAQTEVSADPLYSEEQLAIKLFNEERVKRGLAPLRYAPEMDAGAAVRVNDISRYFSHSRPDGSDYKTAWPGLKVWGENAAYGYQDAQSLVAALMASDAHRANVCNKNFTCMTIKGVKQGNTTYWIQAFGVY